jgi:hypothetical protein
MQTIVVAKKWVSSLLLAALFFTFAFSCAPSKMMTYNSYQNISVGDSIFDVESLVGKPYEIRNIGDAKQEYVYIERIPTSDSPGLFREYILIVIDGNVIEKRTHETQPSPIQLNSI